MVNPQIEEGQDKDKNVDINCTDINEDPKKMIETLQDNYEDIDEIKKTIGKKERTKLGLITLKNGSTYTGEWANGMKDGYGEMCWLDGLYMLFIQNFKYIIYYILISFPQRFFL